MQPTASTVSSSTVSQSFTTLIPGGGRAEPSEVVEEVSRTITSLTPVLTISGPESTWTSFALYTTVEEQVTTLTSVDIESTGASQAAQTSAVADADSSPTPEVIRVHHHPHNLSKDAIHGLIAFGALGKSSSPNLSQTVADGPQRWIHGVPCGSMVLLASAQKTKP